MSTRDAILSGVRAATEVHARFGLEEKLESGDRPIDVFSLIQEMGIFMLFRPLEGLLGSYMGKPYPGILVTTNRNLAIQRFTAAHELGHFLLGHSNSVDTEGSIALARQGNTTSPFQEIEAESFASELLLPSWLIMAIASRQNWGRSDLRNPDVVYQLSLRAGASYEATWRMLVSNKWISSREAQFLSETPPKTAKLKVLDGVQPVDSWADAIKVSSNDNLGHLLSGPNDTVIVEVEEHTSSGYTWQVEAHSIEVVSDKRISEDNGSIGGPTKRTFVIRGREAAHIKLNEVRGWDSRQHPINSLDFFFDFHGKEVGLPRIARQ